MEIETSKGGKNLGKNKKCVGERSIEIERTPLTKEDAVGLINKNMAPRELIDDLFESIFKMINGLVYKNFLSMSEEDREDLSQMVFLIIFEKLYKYNRDIAKFTTFSYMIAQSVIRSLKSEMFRTKDRMKEINISVLEIDEEYNIFENQEDKESFKEDLETKMQEIVSNLFIKFPGWKRFLHALFCGCPSDEDYIVGFKTINHASEVSGVSRSMAKAFFSKAILPQFEEIKEEFGFKISKRKLLKEQV